MNSEIHKVLSQFLIFEVLCNGLCDSRNIVLCPPCRLFQTNQQRQRPRTKQKKSLKGILCIPTQQLLITASELWQQEVPRICASVGGGHSHHHLEAIVRNKSEAILLYNSSVTDLYNAFYARPCGHGCDVRSRPFVPRAPSFYRIMNSIWRVRVRE